MGRPNENQGCGCLIALVALIAFAIYSWHRWTLVAPFRDHIAAYASVSGPRAAGGPYVTGKAVVVDQANARMDNLFFELPDGLRAAQPGEVGTVVRVQWGDERVGTYTDGAAAYVLTCRLTLVDRTRPAVVDERAFRGTQPPGLKPCHS